MYLIGVHLLGNTERIFYSICDQSQELLFIISQCLITEFLIKKYYNFDMALFLFYSVLSIKHNIL